MHLATINLSKLDLTVLAVYFAAIVGAGVLFKDKFAGTKDYFAAGGNMLWWMAGFSAISSELSVWAFTAVAGRYASDGWLLLYSNLLCFSTLPLLYWIGPKFRRLRVTTALEAVGLRFGPTTESFYSFLIVPLGVWTGALGIHATAIFFSAATSVDKNVVVLVIGGFTVLMSAMGGIWAVATSDLFQGVLTLFMMLVLLVFCVTSTQVQSAGGFLASIPHELVDPFAHAKPFTVGIWTASMVLFTLVTRLSVTGDGWKFIVARSESDCRRMVTVILVVGLLMTPIVALPAVLSRQILGPEMVGAASASGEGAIAHLAHAVLPAGLIGLMLAGIIAAAMNSMDHALNRNSGFFVTSIYQRFFRQDMSASESVRLCRLTTIVSGAISMGIALLLNAYRKSGLFDFVLHINGVLSVPLLVPLALGLVFRRSPSWTGWGGVVVCAVVAFACDLMLNVSRVFSLLGISQPAKRDFDDVRYALQIFLTVGAGMLFFGVASHLARRRVPVTDEAGVPGTFWARWREPVVDVASAGTVAFQQVNSGKVLIAFGVGLVCLLPLFGFTHESIYVAALSILFLIPGTVLFRLGKRAVALNPPR